MRDQEEEQPERAGAGVHSHSPQRSGAAVRPGTAAGSGKGKKPGAGDRELPGSQGSFRGGPDVLPGVDGDSAGDIGEVAGAGELESLELEQAYRRAALEEQLERLAGSVEARERSSGFDSRLAYAFLQARREILLGPGIRHVYPVNASFEKLAALCSLKPQDGAEGFKALLGCCAELFGCVPLSENCREGILRFFRQEPAFCRERLLYLLGAELPGAQLLEHFLVTRGLPGADRGADSSRQAGQLLGWLQERPGNFFKNKLLWLLRRLRGYPDSLPEPLQLAAGRAVLADAAGRVLPELEYYLSRPEGSSSGSAGSRDRQSRDSSLQA